MYLCSAGHLEFLADSSASKRAWSVCTFSSLQKTCVQRGSLGSCFLVLPRQKLVEKAHHPVSTAQIFSHPGFSVSLVGTLPPRSVGAGWAGARSRSRSRLASRRMNLRAQSPNQNRTLPTSLLPFPFTLLLPAQIFLFLFSLLQIFFRQKGRIKSDSSSFSELSLLHRHLNRCHLLDGNRFLLLPFFLRLRSRGENFNPALFPHSQLRL